MLRNNQQVFRLCESFLHCRPPSEAALRSAAYRYSYSPLHDHVRRYRGYREYRPYQFSAAYGRLQIYRYFRTDRLLRHIYDLMRDLVATEDIFIEPSACASFWGPIMLKDEKVQAYIKKMGLEDKMANATHIPWATGGSLVPQDIREEYMHTHLK